VSLSASWVFYSLYVLHSLLGVLILQGTVTLQHWKRLRYTIHYSAPPLYHYFTTGGGVVQRRWGDFVRVVDATTTLVHSTVLCCSYCVCRMASRLSQGTDDESQEPGDISDSKHRAVREQLRSLGHYRKHYYNPMDFCDCAPWLGGFPHSTEWERHSLMLGMGGE